MISAVVLTNNSEETIKETLQSIAWCDEIIIIDDQSTDSTKTIASSFVTKWYERKLLNDYASQRNFGLSKVTHDWVLFVDDDEVLSDHLAKEIQQFCQYERTIPKKSQNNQISGYNIRRIDTLWGIQLHFGETGHKYFLRLGKKGAGLWVEPVHEYWNIKGNIGMLSNPLYHTPHKDIQDFIYKINKYSSIRANYLFKNNIKEPIYNIFGKPCGKLLFNVIFLQGFRDGTAGIVHAFLMSFHSFLVRAKLWKLWNDKRLNHHATN